MYARSHKLDLVIPQEWNDDWSVDWHEYCGGLDELGVSSHILALSISKTRAEPITSRGFVERLDRQRMTDPKFWRVRSGQYLLVNGYINIQVYRAMSRTGCAVLALQDTAGDIDPWRHLYSIYHRSLADEPSAVERARAAWLVAKRAVFLRVREMRDTRERFASVGRMVVQTEVARDRWVKYLRRVGVASPGAKITAVPRPLRPRVLQDDVVGLRAERVMAVGRWPLRQKNVGLLLRAWRAVERHRQRAELILIGEGAGAALARYGRRLKRVMPLESISAEELAKLYATSRVCAVSSRWESYHQVSFEALANGCTVAGVPGIPIDEILRFSDHGTRAIHATAGALAAAVLAELARWDAGEHVPQEVATFWRGRCNRATVCQHLLDLLPEQALATS